MYEPEAEEALGKWSSSKYAKLESILNRTLSEKWPAVENNAADVHGIHPAKKSGIFPVKETVDGAERRFLAYSCPALGGDPKLYYTDNQDDWWVPYSENPIISTGVDYTVPSCVIETDRGGGTWDVFTYHLFIARDGEGKIDRFTSTDGINFTFQETVLDIDYKYTNCYVWVDPVSGDYLLYYIDVDAEDKRFAHVKRASEIDDLASAAGVDIGGPHLESMGCPAVVYYNKKYVLLYETNVKAGDSVPLWVVKGLKSDTPDEGFEEIQSAPFLTHATSPVPVMNYNDYSFYLYHGDLTDNRFGVIKARRLLDPVGRWGRRIVEISRAEDISGGVESDLYNYRWWTLYLSVAGAIDVTVELSPDGTDWYEIPESPLSYSESGDDVLEVGYDANKIRLTGSNATDVTSQVKGVF